MSDLLQWLVVCIAVLASVLYALRALTPFRARIWIATHTAGRLPDRLRIWIAGPTACQACGAGLVKPVPKRR
jgi:hypothetical protein